MADKKENSLHALYKKEPQLFNYGIVAAILLIIAVGFALGTGGGSSKIAQCNGILLSSYRYGCISTLAISSNNYTLCNGLPSQYSDNCFATIAQSTGNQTLCGRLSTQQADYSCVYGIANQSGSYSGCAALPESMQAQCFTSIGVERSDIGACAQITNSSGSKICNYAVQLRSALNANTPGECAIMSNDTNSSFTAQVASYSGIYQYGSGAGGKLSAAEILSGSSQQPINYVQFLSGIPYSPRDLCYLYFASEAYNITYCGSVSNATISRLCEESVQAGLSQNSAGTSTFANQTGINSTQIGNLTSIPAAECANLSISKSTCNALSKIFNAVTARNQTACASLSGQFQYQCYSSMARAYDNSTYCSYINNASANSACVGDLYYNNTT